MKSPELSAHFLSRNPSVIRMAQIEFAKRGGDTVAVNTAIGNVSLPMHPEMTKRMASLKTAENSPFKDGVVKYSPTVGYEEANQAFLNVIASSDLDTTGLYSQITDGGSQAMELVVLGVCGPAGTNERPLLILDPGYTNYPAMTSRLGRGIISVTRDLQEDGQFTIPDMNDIEALIQKHQPGALIIIPYDNPTGQYMSKKALTDLATLCVKYNMWLVSDEAYRELFYDGEETISVWSINDKDVPGIEGRRMSIETSSKVWNACGLRTGALVTDNALFHQKSVAENTANLCSNVIGQYIFGSLAHVEKKALKEWYKTQRNYYNGMLSDITSGLKKNLPGIIVSSPDASIYSVVDVRNIAPENFDALEFVMYCAQKGTVMVDGKPFTLLVSPMAGFYNGFTKEENPGRTQMRIAYVEPPEKMAMVPDLFAELFKQYTA